MDSDPTIDFLTRLAEPNRWVVRRNVPVFVPHVRMGRDGTEVRVTAADLPRIAANMRDLEREAGVVGRITPGHTQPHLPETGQPPVWGFMRNARAQRWGPGRQPGVVVDCYYFPEHAAQADRYPYRSAEYYPREQTIRGLALLTRDPFLDLGVVAYDRPGAIYHYPPETAMTEESTQTATDDLLTPEEQKTALRFARYLRELGLDDGAARYARLEETVTELGAAVGRLTADRDAAGCEMMLDHLAALGYSLTPEERADELEQLKKRAGAERAKYRDRLRTRYAGRVAPVAYGGMIPLHPGPVEGQTIRRELTSELMDRALAYQAEKGCGWAEARAFALR